MAAYAVSAGLAAIGIAGVVKGRKILASPGVDIALMQVTKLESPDEKVMRSGQVKGNQYTSFFTPDVEKAFEGRFMAWRNDNQITSCKLVTGYMASDQGGGYGWKYLEEAADAAEASLTDLYPEGGPWLRDDFTSIDTPAQAEESVGLWRWWLWNRVIFRANDYVCQFLPVT